LIDWTSDRRGLGDEALEACGEGVMRVVHDHVALVDLVGQSHGKEKRRVERDAADSPPRAS